MAVVEYLGQLSDSCGSTQNLALPDTVEDIAVLRICLNRTFEGDPLSSSSIRAIVNGEVVSRNAGDIKC